MLRRGVGRRQTLRIHNEMDESEAEKKKKRCNLCGADGHTYKKCPKMQEDNVGAEVGPSGNHICVVRFLGCSSKCVGWFNYIAHLM